MIIRVLKNKGPGYAYGFGRRDRDRVNIESVNTFASLGTFIVIAVTAIAATIQLRHLRASNQLTGLLTVLARVENPTFNEWADGARRILPPSLEDPVFRESIQNGTFERRDNPWLNLANSYEWFGSLVKHGLIPQQEVMDVYASRILQAWDAVQDVVVIVRRTNGPAVWENFEYLVVLAREWSSTHPNGLYPRHFPRLNLTDKWLAEDQVAGFAPATSLSRTGGK